MPVLPIQFELIETQGYLTIAVYIHYFAPGRLKLHTEIQFLNSESFEGIFGSWKPVQSSRRWLQLGESPYPGYCRAPGSSICLPALCNCEKLIHIWNEIQEKQNTLKAKKEKDRNANKKSV